MKQQQQQVTQVAVEVPVKAAIAIIIKQFKRPQRLQHRIARKMRKREGRIEERVTFKLSTRVL